LHLIECSVKTEWGGVWWGGVGGFQIVYAFSLVVASGVMFSHSRHVLQKGGVFFLLIHGKGARNYLWDESPIAL
jgi:hypothetical protein